MLKIDTDRLKKRYFCIFVPGDKKKSLEKHRITGIRHLTPSTFVLRLEKNGMEFQTGQYLVLRRPGTIDQREYSIYSGEHDNYLEVLVREVINGKVSPRLKTLSPGDPIEVDGPFGFFRFAPRMFSPKKFLFVATGTGISPFRSFVRTWPGLDYQLIHGVRYGEEAYDHGDFEQEKTTLCTSTDRNGHFMGRVTGYLKNLHIDPETSCFLCGNSQMIHDVFDILAAKGVPVQNIYTEVYF